MYAARSNAPEQEFDSLRFAQNMTDVMQEWHGLVAELATRNSTEEMLSSEKEMMPIGQAFADLATRLMSDPARLLDMQMDLMQRFYGVWGETMQRFLGQPSEQAAPASRDKRFADPAWSSNAYFDFIKQSYLLSSRWLEEVTKTVAGEDPKTAKRIDFYTRQFIDAMSPSNFLLTNPQALKATIESHGENLVRGFRQLRQDFSLGGGRLQIRMTDEKAFTLGETIATSKGQVVYRNALIELLQYAPLTKEVHKTPLLLIPAWINKFYIFDMQEQNSYVRWLSEQGYTVFVISWVNPDERQAETTFEDYMRLGPLSALDAIEGITGEKQTAAIGYCLGGTLLAITLAWLKAKKKDKRIVSATYLTTMIDFSEPGELGVFIDEPQLEALEERMNVRGYLEGREMAATFNMLRANDLIWSFVVNHYLLGKEPFPFDLLYWNADSTRMPAKMHSFYLRNMYLNNKLHEKGGITVAGVPIDLSSIETPTYILSTRDDHIAPWRSTYASTGIYRGDITFTLAASGHIAGVINPPAKGKYGFWTGHLEGKPGADQWFAQASECPGSWWPHWEQWQAERAGEMIPAREVPNKGLGQAPGSYVTAR